MNAVAADIMSCVANYGRGGIDALPAPALHEQMNDPDWEMSADEICHIAINVASDMISEVDMANCSELAPRTAPKAESVHQVVKEMRGRRTVAAARTGDQRLATNQSHNQSHRQTSQSAIKAAQWEIKVEGCRLPISRGKGARRSEARSDDVSLQHSLESLTGEMWKAFTQVSILVKRAIAAGEESEQLRGLSRISAMQKRAAEIRARCEKSPEYEVMSRRLRGDVLLQLYTMAEGAWQAAAGQTDRAAEEDQQGSADPSEQQVLMEDLAVRTMGDNVADLWFEDCREEPEELQQYEKAEDGWREWHQRHPELGVPAQVKRVPGSALADENH
jgi:hypothetical protein